MILTGMDIHRAVLDKDIIISPYNANNLNPNSYNLTLSNQVVKLTDSLLDLAREPKTESCEIGPEGLILYPNELYLMQTVERTATSRFVPCIEGRSSVARMGISIHATAGFGDIGFDGTWTLEVTVVKPTKVYAGVKLCQIYFMETNYKNAKLYEGKYLKQDKPRISQIFLEKDSWLR